MNEKPEALQFADDRPSSWNIDELYQWATDAEELIRSMQARITETEKDAERYQLQKGNPHIKMDVFLGKYRAHNGHSILTDWCDTYDEAFDTAMQKD